MGRVRRGLALLAVTVCDITLLVALRGPSGKALRAAGPHYI
jgi:hypothetical protein